MQVLFAVLMSVCAFILGSCPFSVWIGRHALHRDIRRYGDHNPGSSNVFRAGSKKWGIVALVLDILKGAPVVLISRLLFGFSQPILYIIAFCAVLGHAYSPFLGFRGGKALAVFAGTLLGLLQWDAIAALMVLFILGFLFFSNDSWTVIVSMVGAIVLMLFWRAEVWEILYIAAVALLFIIKHFHDLRNPNHAGRLVDWVRSRRKTV